MRAAPNPAAIVAGLLVVFRRVAARVPLPGDPAFGPLDVYDGPAPESGFGSQWLSVGMPWEADQQPVTVERAELGGGRRVRLDYAVACAAYAGAGDAGFAQYRDQVAALVVAVDTELALDRNLGGLAARVGVADLAMTQGADSQGYGAMANFAIAATVL